MEIMIDRRNGTLYLQPIGRIDSDTAPMLEEAIRSAPDDICAMVFDFEHVEYITSAGLRALLFAQKQMGKKENMAVRNASEAVMRVFEITGLTEILNVAGKKAQEGGEDDDSEYLMESKLSREAPALHDIYSENMAAFQNLLDRYKCVFSGYTDHTVLHSIEVSDFCNTLIGGEIALLNVDEIFILLMAIYLHDVGMGVSREDFEEFTEQLPSLREYRDLHPDAELSQVMRAFHHELSGCFIRKYAMLFDFPSPEYIFCVVQTARGHRKTDLWDEKEYPSDLVLPDGNPVRLPYLAALIRLADELDIAADRNLRVLYDENNVTNHRSYLEFSKHRAIKSVICEKNGFTVEYHVDDPEVMRELQAEFRELREKLDYCARVTSARTPFTIRHTELRFKEI